MSRRIVLLLALALAQVSCVSANYVRFARGEPMGQADVIGLHPGQADLQDCLGQLGAPQQIWPLNSGSFAMAYSWLDRADWAVSVSYAFSQFLNLRLSFDDTDADIDALVLIFDPAGRLVSLEVGKLAEFVP